MVIHKELYIYAILPPVQILMMYIQGYRYRENSGYGRTGWYPVSSTDNNDVYPRIQIQGNPGYGRTGWYPVSSTDNNNVYPRIQIQGEPWLW